MSTSVMSLVKKLFVKSDRFKNVFEGYNFFHVSSPSNSIRFKFLDDLKDEIISSVFERVFEREARVSLCLSAKRELNFRRNRVECDDTYQK